MPVCVAVVTEAVVEAAGGTVEKVCRKGAPAAVLDLEADAGSGARRAALPRTRASRQRGKCKAAGKADGDELPVISEPREMFFDMVRCS
jgi:hypothetical protein